MLAFDGSGSSGPSLLPVDVVVLCFWLVNIPVKWVVVKPSTRALQRMSYVWLELMFAASTTYILVVGTAAFAAQLRGPLQDFRDVLVRVRHCL